jgi:F-type H+-transporting ATPase subunit epsilon
MAKLKLEVITPEKVVVDKEVLEVQLPTPQGEIGILTGHIPLISRLALTGVVKYRDEAGSGLIVVGNGFVEVSGEKITILAGAAESPKEINVEETRREIEAAERSLKAANQTADVQEALEKLERARIRVQIAQQAK